MTFMGSHSFNCEKQAQRICCEWAIWPTRLLTLASGSPLMDQRWSQVPEHQVAMSPVRSLMSMAVNDASFPVNWRMEVKRDQSQTMTVQSPSSPTPESEWVLHQVVIGATS
jgi:hypothetical protein